MFIPVVLNIDIVSFVLFVGIASGSIIVYRIGLDYPLSYPSVLQFINIGWILVRYPNTYQSYPPPPPQNSLMFPSIAWLEPRPDLKI